MNKLLMVIVFGTLSSYAQTIKVNKVKGSKAIVEFEGIDVKIGEKLSVKRGSGFSVRRELRERKQSVSFRYTVSDSKTDAASSGSSTTSETKSQDAEMSYGYSWGRYEIGAYIDSESEKKTSSETKGIEVGAYGQFNFIENVEDNDFIPYSKLNFGLLSAEVTSSSSSLKVSGTAWTLNLGLLWFPFSQIFSFDFGYKYGVGGMESESSPKVTFKIKDSGLYGGRRIYF